LLRYLRPRLLLLQLPEASRCESVLRRSSAAASQPECCCNRIPCFLA